MRRHTALAAIPLAGVAAIGVVVATSVDGRGSGNGARAAGPSHAGTAVVRRRTLVDRQRVDGTLGYAGKAAATNRLSGTVTWLPHTGDVIHPGQTLFKVDGKPVVLMDGTLPAYRTLRTGIADGSDVRQLERGLALLGYSPGTIDDHYSATTAVAVKAWQGDHGLAKSGQLELGRIVFLSGPRRVTDVKVSLGSTTGSSNGNGSNPSAKFASYTQSTTPTQTTPQGTTTTPTQTTPTQTTPTQTTPTQTTPQQSPTRPKKKKPKHNGNGNANASENANRRGNARPTGNANPTGNADPTGNGNGDSNAPATEVLGTTSTRRVVTAKVDVADQTLASKGRPVRVELPNGQIVPGRITNVGTVATAASDGNDPNAGSGNPTITITIRLRSARAAGRLDEAPVSVQIARTTKRNVLAVPVQALVARPGGRYAVERADGRLASVTPGVFANGYVEIVSGGIREGDRVRVPR
jgi:Putative peptidoglycan binding domain